MYLLSCYGFAFRRRDPLAEAALRRQGLPAEAAFRRRGLLAEEAFRRRDLSAMGAKRSSKNKIFSIKQKFFANLIKNR